MNTIIAVSVLIIAMLLLTFAIIKSLIPLAKKKDISLMIAIGSFIILVNL